MSGKPKSRAPSIANLQAHREQAVLTTPCLGTITAWSAEGGVVVDYDGNVHGPLPALSLVALSSEEVEAHIASGTQVLLTFDRGQSERPIILGVVQPSPTRPTPEEDAEPRGTPELRAIVDGEEVVVVEGKERVELRCGKASIVLTKAGKVLIQGTYISSRSSGAHRIRGGSVEVN